MKRHVYLILIVNSSSHSCFRCSEPFHGRQKEWRPKHDHWKNSTDENEPNPSLSSDRETYLHHGVRIEKKNRQQATIIRSQQTTHTVAGSLVHLPRERRSEIMKGESIKQLDQDVQKLHIQQYSLSYGCSRCGKKGQDIDIGVILATTETG